jgi:polysaccharide export outer membrane protein
LTGSFVLKPKFPSKMKVLLFKILSSVVVSTGILLATTLLLSSCGTPAGSGSLGAGNAMPLAQPVSTAGTNAQAGVGIDTLRVGDKLTITVADPANIPVIEQKIREDGKIKLLFDNSDFDAAGKTISELEKDIRDHYVPKFFQRLSIQIKVEQRIIYVGGQVRRPDRYEYLSTMTVLQAIKAAGDFTDYAKKTVVEVTRADGTKLIVNCKKAQKNPKLDIPIYPGDSIYVPVRIW